MIISTEINDQFTYNVKLLAVVKVENFSYRYYACQKLITMVEVK